LLLNMMERDIPPRPALLLGYAGLLPAAASCLALLFGPAEWRQTALQAHLIYAAVILGFVGGAWWGQASARRAAGQLMLPLTVSVLPSLAGWALAMAGDPVALIGMGLVFPLTLLGDRYMLSAGHAPSWWPALRRPLSLGMAVLAFVSGAVAAFA
jgi:hypothetical protein